MATVLKAQLDELMNTLFGMGYLDEHFQQLEVGQDEATPNFVAEIITLYCDNSERIISEITNLLQKTTVDYAKLDLYVHQFKGSSSSVGAKRVTLACMDFRVFVQQNNKEGCIMALDAIKWEFYDLRNKLQAMLHLERQIQDIESKQGKPGQ